MSPNDHHHNEAIEQSNVFDTLTKGTILTNNNLKLITLIEPYSLQDTFKICIFLPYSFAKLDRMAIKPQY